MNDTNRYKGKLIDERDIHIPSLMTYMGFNNPAELHSVKQAIRNMFCDVETVRWAVNWMEDTWGGTPYETREFLGIGVQE